MAKLTLFANVPLKANKEDRTLSGLLLPFGEVGYTNLGKLTASKESQLEIADDVVVNIQHNGTRPVGKAISLTAADAGIETALRIFNTRDGDDALTEYEEGVRCGLSIEIEPIVVKSGKIVSGTVTGVALVTEPAFKSARLAAEVLPDVADTPTEPQATTPEVVIDGKELDNVTDVQVTETKIEVTTKAEEPPADPEGSKAMAENAAVNNPALAAAAAGKDKKDDKNTLFATLANGYANGQTGAKLEAALSDIVPANILGIEQPQYVGQMWAGQPYERRIIPLFDHSDLNSFNISGWDWGTAPTVGLYTGNKTDIPSAGITTVAKSGTLQRIAGGHDIDRKFRDFSNTEFWEAYFTKMAESYAKVSDTYIRDQVVSSIGAGTQRQHLLTANAPAGVPTVLWQIVEGCVKMLDDLNTLPTFALVTSDYWKPLFYTKQNDVLAYLNLALGLKEGSMEGFRIIPVPVGSLTNGGWTGKTIVGHKSAFNVYELPGAPIRVEAEDIARGGIDEALFGYCGYMIENAKGLISFDAPAAS